MSDSGKTPPPQNPADEHVLEQSRRHTRRSFAVAAAAAAAGYGVYRWIAGSPEIGRQELPLRRAFQADAAISRTLFDERGLAPTYTVAQSSPLRLNGNIGMARELVPESFRLQLVGAAHSEQHPLYSKDVTAWEYRYTDTRSPSDQAQNADVKSAPGNGAQVPASEGSPPATTKTGEPLSIADRFNKMNREINHRRVRGDAEAGPSASGLTDGTPGLLLTMDDVRKLPHHDLVTQFKCIEGWSQIVHWGGVRLVDLLEAYPPQKIDGRDPRYIYMETPDGNYYGGYDISACRHPQSLLVTEMAGQPITADHGAPLRLHMPIKYGYKQLKRIGLIAYMDTTPDDYWTKLGYDWYAGL